MRTLILFVTLGLTFSPGVKSPGGRVWADLKAKRDMLPGAHQEFVVVHTTSASEDSQSSKRSTVIEMAPGRWRQQFLGGGGGYVRVFDGKDLLWMEEGGDQFVRTRNPTKEALAPEPYLDRDQNWSRAVEISRLPCGLPGRPGGPGRDDLCVTVDVPLQGWTRSVGGVLVTMTQGLERITLHLETGLIVSCRIVETFADELRTYRSETTYTLTRMSYGAPADPALFRLPSGDMREVKKLPPSDAGRIEQRLAGKTAPDLAVTDLSGYRVDLAAFKGKTVLLDFWTTWCPPCRADGVELDKLYRKYGDRDLVVIGISVDEERAVVEKFLKDHPHAYPIVLTTENDLSSAYRIAAFPTYVVIDKNGAVVSAMQGDQGFAKLRRTLKKAGLEPD